MSFDPLILFLGGFSLVTTIALVYHMLSSKTLLKNQNPLKNKIEEGQINIELNEKNNMPAILKKIGERDLASLQTLRPEHVKKLNSLNIRTVNQLLEAASTRDGVKEINQKTGIYSKLIDQWVQLADFSRLQGLPTEYVRLLNASGIDRVKKLVEKEPNDLYKEIRDVNLELNIVEAPPSTGMLVRWIRQAREIYSDKTETSIEK
jgi:hypothetical protein